MSFIAAGVAACSNGPTPPEAYPAAPTDSSVVDNYFGIQVPDPYRPLENDTAAATLEWVKAQNAVTNAYLNAIPFRAKLRQRLGALADYPKQGLPSREKDGRYYFYANSGSQNQSVLYASNHPDGRDAQVILDPNTLSQDGTVALNDTYLSPDMRYMAYTINRNGSDWTEIYVLDLKTLKTLPDHIEWAKFTPVAWHGDGFYYSAYPAPEAGGELSNANETQRVYFHRLGTPQSADQVAYEDPQHPLYFHSAQIDSKQTALMLYMAGNGTGNGMKIKDLRKPNAPWVTMEESQDRELSVFDVEGDTLYIETTWGAPRGRIMVASINKPQREHWRELIPEQKGVLVGAQRAGDKFIFTYEQDAANHAFVYTPQGQLVREMKLPTLGSLAVSASDESPEVLYALTSFTSPSAIYSYDLASGQSTLIKETKVNDFNPNDYETRQVFFTSKDGTKVPMFITCRKDVKLNGQNPVLLYGYGGFGISLTPAFSAMRLAWLEQGGVYVTVNLRGGSEYGEEWHQAGTKMQKLNVFNDFIAAAEYLVDNHWTNSELMAAMGGSNGGLLIGAVTNMCPYLFRVVIPQVGVMDMMRYHRFTIGWNWASDYGTSADSPEMAQYLLNYSPLHNIKSNGPDNYPAILITTADHDDRVVPAHSFKYAAALQAAATGPAPKLIRIESNAGHGSGKPLSKSLDEYADVYSFIFYNLGVTPHF